MDLVFLKQCKRKYIHFKSRKWVWPSATNARVAQYKRNGDCHPFIRICPAPSIKERLKYNKPYRKKRYDPNDYKGFV